MKNIITKHRRTKILLILTLSLSVGLSPSSSYAQILNKVHQQQEQAIQEQIYNLKITKKTKNQVVADFIDLTPQAKELGFENISLIGEAKVVSKDPTGVITYNILWSKTYQKNSEIENNLTRPFLTTNLKVKPDIEQFDVVKARGSFSEIVKVQEATVSIAAKAEEKAEEENEEAADSSRPSPSSSSSSPQAQVEESNGFTPSFEVAEPEDIVSTEGCEIVVDITALTANQQTRTFRDGQPLTTCSPSFESGHTYALTKDYGVCPPSIEIPNGVYEKYNLGYQKEEGGQRIVINNAACFKDETRPLALTTTSCGYEPDDNDSTIYHQKEEIKYTHNNIENFARPCSRTGTTYVRQTKTGVCATQTNLTTQKVTPFVYYFLTVDSAEVAVSGCTADMDNQTDLLSEECTGADKYFWDKDVTGLVFLQQRYYSLDVNNNKEYATSCAPTQTSYSVAWDSTGCTIVHDDANLNSNLYQKPLAILTSSPLVTEEIPGQGCQDNQSFSPYTNTGSKWSIAEDFSNAAIVPANNTVINPSQTGSWIPVGFYLCSDGPFIGDNTSGFCSWNNVMNGHTGKAWCLSKVANAPWTFGTETLDVANSDQTPNTGGLQRSGVSSNRLWSGRWDNNSYSEATRNYTCSVGNNPICSNIARLVRNPYYQRVDGSFFADTATISEQKHVCGTGSLLNGRIE